MAPFDAAAVVMLAGGVIVAFSWSENYGDSSERKSFGEQLRNGAHAIYSSTRPLTTWGCESRDRAHTHVPVPAQDTFQVAVVYLKA